MAIEKLLQVEKSELIRNTRHDDPLKHLISPLIKVEPLQSQVRHWFFWKHTQITGIAAYFVKSVELWRREFPKPLPAESKIYAFDYVVAISKGPTFYLFNKFSGERAYSYTAESA